MKKGVKSVSHQSSIYHQQKLNEGRKKNFKNDMKYDKRELFVENSKARAENANR